MAGKYKTTVSEQKHDQKKDKDLHGKCEAWGCNRWGQVHIGKWYCRYHLACHGKNIGEQLSHVTIILKNHEPEVNWYETLLASSEVDYVCDDLKQRAPVGMEPETKESFKDYRARIEAHINKLLDVKRVKLDVEDRKKLASGEKQEHQFDDYLPEFQ